MHLMLNYQHGGSSKLTSTGLGINGQMFRTMHFSLYAGASTVHNFPPNFEP